MLSNARTRGIVEIWDSFSDGWLNLSISRRRLGLQEIQYVVSLSESRRLTVAVA